MFIEVKKTKKSLMEQWKDIPGYEGLYQISDQGNIIRIDKGRHRLKKQFKNENGYFIVSLCKKSHQKSVLVHRLIAICFIPNEKKKPFINHIDSNPANNKIENLEWCTQKENMIHAFKGKKAKRNRKAVLQLSGDKIIKRFESVNETALFGFIPTAVSQCGLLYTC